MKQKKVSVKGLQNIGAVLGRSDAPEPAPNRERRDINGIFDLTCDKVIAAVTSVDGGSIVTRNQRELIKTYVNAGLREAYNLGHAEALAQGSEVDKMLTKQYEVRTGLLTPTVVCAVMEQRGLSSMTLDLARMATVFDRMDIEYTLDADTNVMTYSARPTDTLGEIPDLAFDPSEFDNEQTSDTLEADLRHQVEDIEQTRCRNCDESV